MDDKDLENESIHNGSSIHTVNNDEQARQRLLRALREFDNEEQREQDTKL